MTGLTSHVIGEGQKTSSVLSRALSRIEMKIEAKTSPTCSTEVETDASPVVRRDRRDSTWILRGPSLVLLILHQICGTSYYWRYLEHTYSMSHYRQVRFTTSHANYESYRVSVQRVTMSHRRTRIITSHREVHPHNRNQNIPSSPSMNPDPMPPVRPLLTHVIVDEPLRREAGINRGMSQDWKADIFSCRNIISAWE